VHAQDEDLGEQEEFDEDDEDIAARIENIKRAQGIMILNSPNFIKKSYQLTATVMKAEGIPKCVAGSINPFVSVRVNGCVLRTKTVPKNPEPIFACRF